MDDHGEAATATERSRAAQITIQVVRVLLVGFLLLQLVAMLWLTSRDGNLDSLVADLRAGRVTVLEIGEAPTTQGFVLTYDRDPGTVIRWRTTDGAWYVMPTEHPDSPDPLGPPDMEFGRVPPIGEPVVGMLSATHRQVAEEIAIAYAGHADSVLLRSTEDNPWQWGLTVGTGLAVVVMLVTLVAGPHPRQATKLAWFWLYFAPAGIGMLAALAADAPWSDSPAWRERPLTAWPAVGLTVLAGVSWGLMLSWLGL